MKKRSIFKALTLFIAAHMAVLLLCDVQAAKADDDTIYSGVYLDGVYVGGMTKEEAMKEYADYMDGADKLKLTFTTSEGTYSATLKDIGFSVSAQDAVDQAYHYGRQGNILTRYKEIRALESDSVVLVPTKTIDKKKLKKALESQQADIVTAPKNASIKRVDGEFVVEEGKVGTTIQIDDTMKAVQELLKKEWTQKDLKVAAVVEEQEPQYTADDFEKIDSVLGTFDTEYNSGNTARSQNLSTGASKISGTVLMPGEQFSVYETVSPFTEENGYANAGQYVNNELVDGLGGGICQVSTTLYNAVLRAELEVDERYPHSLTVSYVPLGMDAAIAGDYMDFKFTNDTEYPIYIDGYAGGGTISFAIYGHDTRPKNRTISYESKTVETYEPGSPEEISDDSLAEGTRITESSGHTGYYVEVWKHIYIDGTETDTVKVDGSKYNAVASKVRVGTKKSADTTKSTEKQDKENDKEKNKDKSDNASKDKATEAEPKNEAPATEAPAAPEPPAEPAPAEEETPAE